MKTTLIIVAIVLIVLAAIYGIVIWFVDSMRNPSPDLLRQAFGAVKEIVEKEEKKNKK